MWLKGRVKIIRKESDYLSVKKGDIIVAYNTKPDIVLVIKKIKVIITEVDNKLCHAAIISREYGIPLVMGVKDIFNQFKDGEVIKVNILSKEIKKC